MMSVVYCLMSAVCPFGGRGRLRSTETEHSSNTVLLRELLMNWCTNNVVGTSYRICSRE